MSRRSDESDSSSEEEAQQGFHSQLNIPSMNVVNMRRHQKKKSKKSEPGSKKFMGNMATKGVRFPDSYSPRHSLFTNSSTNNSSDSDDMLEETEVDPRLPSFSMDVDRRDVNEYTDSEEDVDHLQSPEHEMPQHLDLSDISGSEDMNSKASEGSSRSHKSPGQETDIADQRRASTSSSLKASLNETQGGLRGILRRMTLSNHDRDGTQTTFERGGEVSNSDTFIGRILGGSNGGLSGGGLAPGGSRSEKSKDFDEEKNVGMDGEDGEGIEMRRLDVDSLNEHAHNLIAAHVPGFKPIVPKSIVNEEHHNDTNENGEPLNDIIRGGDDADKQYKEDTFYAPNPDLYLRGGSDDERDLVVDGDLDEVAAPSQVHAGVLSSLLQLYQNPQESKSASSLGASTLMDEQDSMLNSDGHSRSRNASNMDFNKLKSNILKGPHKMTKKLHSTVSRTPTPSTTQNELQIDAPEDQLPSFQNAKPRAPKKQNNVHIPSRLHKLRHHKKAQERQLKITVHIADILQRQRFIIRMCKALMLYGAPTHRLEEYMVMTSRVLEIDGQFVYLPGCMIISFGDASTRTSEVHLVRCNQGLNLSKLSDVHKIYKSVIHDLVNVEEAAKKVEDLLKEPNRYSPWISVLLYGLGSSFVCPFAFGGGWRDVPVTFGVGLCVGYLQFFVSSKSNLYSSVFEVTASIVVAFISRGIGSINGGDTFCFSAICQGSLALILPGYIILCGSLELQSRNLVAGSVRMFYAIIYSLFLGFGITLGAALYGWVDHNSTSETKCNPKHAVNDKFRIFFVPAFAVCLSLINQARFGQIPVMVVIASTGYVGTYFAGRHFSEVSEFTSCIGAFIVGILGNLYSRIWKGMAVSAMLPAIFVQVPSGIASQSSLLSGISSADRITNTSDSSASTSSSSSLSFGSSMVEVSIGISVGLFAATLCVYPLGKKKTGLFTL